MRVVAILSAAVIALYGCGGGGGSNALPSQMNASLPAGTHQAGSSERLYLANGNSMLVFDASANGNVPPLFTITGIPGCSFPDVTGVAVDASGRIFIADPSASVVGSPQISIFTVSAALVPTFVGSITGNLHSPFQIAVDSNGHVYVANQLDSISVYAPGPAGVNGAIAVIQGANTGLTTLHGVAVDATGDIFASNSGGEGGVVIPPSILEFAPGSNGNVAPMRTIVGPNTQLSSPFGIAVDSTGNIYAAGGVPTPGVSVFANGANGDVAPLARITGSNTTLVDPEGVAVDASGKIYVADGTHFRGPGPGVHNEIAVFAPGANGNVAPIAIISGLATGISGPSTLTVR